MIRPDIPQNSLFLAPMAGVTDAPFRSISSALGADFTVTEMISAKGVMLCPFEREEVTWLRAVSTGEKCFLQLFGSDPALVGALAARWAKPPYVGLDLNMGCPAPKIVSGGDGSALLKNLPLAQAVAQAAVQNSVLPVSVKFRMGWDESSINYLEAAKRFEDAGITLLTLHARTRKQMYAGTADWDAIAALVQQTALPVIGNGDVSSPESALALLKHTGCRGVMIGRAAMGDPWLFRSTKALLRGEEAQPVSPKERLSTALSHAKALCEQKGEALGVREMRKQMAWYTKGLRGATAARVALNHALTLEQMQALLSDLLAQQPSE